MELIINKMIVVESEMVQQYRFGLIMLVVASIFGCSDRGLGGHAKLRVVRITNPDEMVQIMQEAEIAFTKEISTKEIQHAPLRYAHFYLDYTYAWVSGDTQFWYLGGWVSWQDLSADLGDGIWQVYHRGRLVMQIRQSDGAVLSMPGLGKNAKQQRLMNEGFVSNAELAVRRAYGKAGKGREQMTYEVFSVYSETEQDIIWYLRLGANNQVVPGYIAIRQKDGVMLGHSYGTYCK